MSEIESIFGERELKILREMMVQKDMSAEAVVRHMFRMGQLVDHHMQQGYKLMFYKGTEVLDPFDNGPKMAPVPDDLSRWLDEGGAE